MTTALPLMKNVLIPLAKSVLVSIGLTAAASATDAAIQNKTFGSGTTAFIISIEIASIEKSGLLIKSVSQTIKNEAKEQNRGFLVMLLGILGASLLGIMLAGKGKIRAAKIANRTGDKTNRLGQEF